MVLKGSALWRLIKSRSVSGARLTACVTGIFECEDHEDEERGRYEFAEEHVCCIEAGGREGAEDPGCCGLGWWSSSHALEGGLGVCCLGMGVKYGLLTGPA